MPQLGLCGMNAVAVADDGKTTTAVYRNKDSLNSPSRKVREGKNYSYPIKLLFVIPRHWLIIRMKILMRTKMMMMSTMMILRRMKTMWMMTILTMWMKGR